MLCVDAIQFSQQPDAACCELPRVLGPGGRAVLTCWEPLGRGDERLPGRLRRVDLAARLTAVGFTSVGVRGRLGWRACERAMWQEPATLDPADDPALESFHDGRHALPRNPRPDRLVIVTAAAPLMLTR